MERRLSKQNWGAQYRLPDCVKSTGIFILLLLHNCPKCNAVFFSSNKTAPIGGHRHAGCWFGRSHCPLLTVIRICRVCAKWIIHEMTQMISESNSSNLKHRDFMIDNRRCTKCISNKCRQRGAGQRGNVRRVVRGKKKNWSSQNIWL